MPVTEPRAVIDVGSHSALLLAAAGSPANARVLLERYRITGLGEGLDAGGDIRTGAARRTRRVVGEYLELCRSNQIARIRLVGTAALREAKNRDAILRILSGPGEPPIRVIDREEEAALTRAGALSGLGLEGPLEQAVVADLGGRSTEVSWGGFTRSLPLGCQRAGETFLHADPPGAEEIDRLQENIEEHLSGLLAPPPAGQLVVSGGTSTTLASMDLGLETFSSRAVHGHRLSRGRLIQLSGRLVSRPLAERLKLPGLEPDRAPVMPAGVIILERLCAWHPAGQLWVSARGLTWGVWGSPAVWES